jgi:hypothetical protein
MRKPNEPDLRHALTVLIEARLDEERAEADYQSAVKRLAVARAQKRAATEKAAAFLAGEGGAVSYDGYVFTADHDRVEMKALAREIRVEQPELLPAQQEAVGT